MRKIKEIYGAFLNGIDLLSFGLLCVILGLTLLQVLLRYIFSTSIIWIEELSPFLHIWMVLLIAAKTRQLKITFLLDKIPERIKKSILFFHLLLKLGILVIFIYGSLGMIALTAGDYFISIPLSIKYLYMAPLVTSVITMIVLGLFVYKHSINSK